MFERQNLELVSAFNSVLLRDLQLKRQTVTNLYTTLSYVSALALYRKWLMFRAYLFFSSFRRYIVSSIVCAAQLVLVDASKIYVLGLFCLESFESSLLLTKNQSSFFSSLEGFADLTESGSFCNNVDFMSESAVKREEDPFEALFAQYAPQRKILRWILGSRYRGFRISERPSCDKARGS